MKSQSIIRKIPPKKFIPLLNELLVPLFPGMQVEGVSKGSRKSAQLVSVLPGQRNIKLRYESGISWVTVSRKQPFVKEEISLIKKFMQISKERLLRNLGDKHIKYLKDSVMTDVVSSVSSVSNIDDMSDFSYEIIHLLDELSSQTYEGNRVSLAVGVDGLNEGKNKLEFREIFKHDFSKVLTNGYDSILGFGKNRCLLNYVDSGGIEAEFQERFPDGFSANHFFPERFKYISMWTACSDKRIAFTLSRSGDILIFYGGSLRYAKRRGRWMYFSHESIKLQLFSGFPSKVSKDFKQELYNTCMDVSFAKTGGCIGVFHKKNTLNDVNPFVSEFDLLFGGRNSFKSSAFRLIIGGKYFHNLSRSLRQDLVSVDGAMVLDFGGKIYASGAILAVSSGSKTGGGRSAAASLMGKSGCGGIKISNDGYVKAYGEDGEEKISVF